MKNCLLVAVLALFAFTMCTGKSDPAYFEKLTDEYWSSMEKVEELAFDMLEKDKGDIRTDEREPDEMELSDPHANWLLNRLTSMYRPDAGSEGLWALSVAMEQRLAEYNQRLQRKNGSAEAAAMAMEEILDIPFGGTQLEMNEAAWTLSVVNRYRTASMYQEQIGTITDPSETLIVLYYHEFLAWHDMMLAQETLMETYTYRHAGYSSMPLYYYGAISEWMEHRAEVLDEEAACIYSSEDYPVRMDTREVISDKKMKELIRFYAEMDKDTFLGLMAEHHEVSRSQAEEYFGEQFVAEEIHEGAARYLTAWEKWRQIRSMIREELPACAQEPFDRLTGVIQGILYRDLEDLKKINA